MAPSADTLSMDTRHEVEVDTKLAELWGETQSAYRALDSLRDSIARMSGAERENWKRSRPYVGNHAEWTAALTEKLATLQPWDVKTAENALAKQADLVAKIADLKAEAAPLEAEFNAAPWSRFFLVQNTNGHIHSSMRCSTCRFDTRFAWLPTLSGLTEKDAVDEHGTILCSVCYPSAPTEWTLGIEKKVDPDTCPGSGSGDWVEGSYKPGWNGNGRARCKHCDQGVSVTTAHNIRKHKKGSV